MKTSFGFQLVPSNGICTVYGTVFVEMKSKFITVKCGCSLVSNVNLIHLRRKNPLRHYSFSRYFIRRLKYYVSKAL